MSIGLTSIGPMSIHPSSAQLEERDLILRGELADVGDVFAEEIDNFCVVQLPRRSHTTFGGAPCITLSRWKSSSLDTST